MSTGVASDIIPLPQRLIKHVGSEVIFDLGRIEKALEKAGKATSELNRREAQLLPHQVVNVLSHRYQ